MEQTQSTGLYLKIARIMGNVARIPKRGRNDFHKYDFVTEGDVVDAIRTQLSEERIAFFARMLSFEQVPAGEKSVKTSAAFEFIFADADTGDVMVCPWHGEALDNGDKGVNKAATAALKYFLLKTFMISTGEDDADGEGHEAQATSRSNASQSRQKAHSSGSTGNNGNSPETAEWTAKSVTIKTDKNGKQFLLYNCIEGKASGRGRDLLRNAGYDCETWDISDKTHDLEPSATVTVKRDGQYWNVTAVQSVELAF